ncbi:MAG: 13e12 repeat-containing protein, partial [Mycobacterium sp.]|nr:13e12 repeat-containing protein [Mycobacterium sp.]
LLPPELIAELAKAARLRPLVHPRDAAPEAGYVPSRALAEFVRLRDLTCRFPGCTVPATRCDVDHSIPHREGGPTHASNLSAKCRLHHLLKTFWGWRDEQLRDGTIIWTSPAGERYVTTPGSALIFSSLCEPTGLITITSREDQPRGDRNVMMPRRLRTRDQQRAAAISAERRHNRERRSTPMPATVCDEDLDYEDTLPVAHDTSPPPF